MTLPTDYEKSPSPIGRMDPVHFIEEAAAAGFGAVGLLLAIIGSGPHYKPLPEEIGRLDIGPTLLKELP